MANIGMLYGDMYLRDAWPIMLQNDVNMNTELQALTDKTISYLFRINAQQINITNDTSIVKFLPEVFSSTHITLGLMLNFFSSIAQNLTLEIKFNGSLLTKIIYQVSIGWNLVSFPYFIPSVGSGIHTIEIVGSISGMSITIEPNSLNSYIQARSIFGASDLPPSVNMFEEILYKTINNNNANVNLEAAILINDIINISQSINYHQVYNSDIAENVIIQLL